MLGQKMNLKSAYARIKTLILKPPLATIPSAGPSTETDSLDTATALMVRNLAIASSKKKVFLESYLT